MQGCGWCSATRQCLPGNGAGPSVGYCDGPHLWQYGTCPTCASYSDNCRQCTLGNHDCAWCGATSTCVNWDDAVCPVGTKLSSCPCEQYQSCASCTSLSDAQCAWCASSDTCLSVTANCTGAVSTSCPCSANKNCDSCLDDFNAQQGQQCSWCGNEVGCQAKGDKKCAVAALSCPSSCAQLSACGACVATPGCAWCDTSNTCVDADKSTCFISHTCPEAHCDKFHTCDTCNEKSEQGCLWCTEGEKASCKFFDENYPANNSCAGLIEHSCAAVCHHLTSCESCQLGRGCGWCTVDGNASCVDLDVTLGVFNHCVFGQCGGPGGLSVTGGFFLGMFVLAVVAALAFGAVTFYRRRQKALYTSL